MASNASETDTEDGFLSSFRRRSRLFVIFLALAGLGLVAAQAWRYARVGMRQDPRYRVTAASIETPPTPPWIRTDIRLEALRDAGLRGDLSVLDPPEQLQKRLADAFAFHPWVEQVGSITTTPPNRVAIQLTYRRPLAAVELGGRPRELVAVDRQGVRLPSGDLSDTQLRYLPRVIGIDSNTLVGEVWRDARVLGAVSLVQEFGERWNSIGLVDIVPHRQPEILGDMRFPVFDLVTRGQTRIVWGAAPRATPPGEASFAAKLSRLQSFVTQHGPLDNNRQSPEIINVRDGLVITPRTAKKEGIRDAKQAKAQSAAEESVVK